MPVPFGPKNAWVAVSDISAADLAAALGIAKLEPAEWEAGIEFAYRTTEPRYTGVGVSITPPLGRWTLCVGLPLFERQKGFTAEISRRLDGREVQYFATHRVSEGHVVERTIDGKVTRYFYYCGCDGEQAEEGEPTPEEIACGFKINPPDDEMEDSDDYWFPDEEFVFAVAGAWSVDPSMIWIEFPEAGPGFVGAVAGESAVQPAAGKPMQPSPPPSQPVAGRSRLRRILDAIRGV